MAEGRTDQAWIVDETSAIWYLDTIPKLLDAAEVKLKRLGTSILNYNA